MGPGQGEVEKLILISILAATIVVPSVFARDCNSRRGLKRMILGLVVFNVVYLMLLTFVYARFYVPETW